MPNNGNKEVLRIKSKILTPKTYLSKRECSSAAVDILTVTQMCERRWGMLPPPFGPPPCLFVDKKYLFLYLIHTYLFEVIETIM
jgi:hypothetical protein